MTTQNNGLVALVTGGSKGIGKEIAKTLAKEGYNVYIAGRNENNLQNAVNEFKEEGLNVNPIQADMADVSSINNLFETIMSEVSCIDVLVNNAGIGSMDNKIWDVNLDDWWNVWNVNLRGPMLLSGLVVPKMLEKNSGKIINIGSYAGIRPSIGTSSYSMSKGALISLTENFGMATKDTGISVFAFSPGLVKTDMTKDLPFFKDVPPEHWTPVEKSGELVIKLISGKYDKLTGCFLHVTHDLDQILENADKIREERLYTLRYVTLDGLVR
ncbi:MAG: SDR family oxidoreductase [Candidatus Heimdallarchaeota archaeon]|nr:SDR family oxidoreductase [Candidatus Heimdallarchaeota archaeon]MDH5646293.1 SDR family oxidoreductase [Candidatus Heimdallarchaeota archaeon]